MPLPFTYHVLLTQYTSIPISHLISCKNLINPNRSIPLSVRSDEITELSLYAFSFLLYEMSDWQCGLFDSRNVALFLIACVHNGSSIFQGAWEYGCGISMGWGWEEDWLIDWCSRAWEGCLSVWRWGKFVVWSFILGGACLEDGELLAGIEWDVWFLWWGSLRNLRWGAIRVKRY